MKPLRIHCLLRDQHAHVELVISALGNAAEFSFDETWDPAALVAAKPALVLCVNDYPYDIVRCLDAARRAGIPSLVLQDGILEWRCQYENPLFGAGGGAPQHQPVIADKIACLGRQSARQIAAWGNPGKVEVTGMPRLDHLLSRPPVPVHRPGHRVLVMTAKNPGFTAAQRDITIQSVRDIQTALAARPDLKVLWRVSQSVATALQVENQLRDVASGELAAVVEQTDAVITTPSTAMLEAMRLGRPVAALDYHNVPRFVPTAWTISAPGQINAVLAELLDPPPAKFAFQNDCLADCLEPGPAAPRVAELIQRLAGVAGHQPSVSASVTGTAPRLDLLYPDSAVFQQTDLRALQVRLARAENENTRLKAENAALRLPTRIAERVRRFAKGGVR
jgi:hypothetical protein